VAAEGNSCPAAESRAERLVKRGIADNVSVASVAGAKALRKASES
jgi:hypothetical protein